MPTVFSHIIEKRFSRVREDVATDALAFILRRSEKVRLGLLKLLRVLEPDLPELYFRTQQVEENMRPDMAGIAYDGLHVFLENKFWAGLTDNQPVAYLKRLADSTSPTILLVVAPAAREQSLWRELLRRVEQANITVDEQSPTSGFLCCARTSVGPWLVLTSWAQLLVHLEQEIVDDSETQSDLLQLRALCESADDDAFLPVALEDLSDQQLPGFILQMSRLVRETIEHGVTEGLVETGGLMPQASWDRIGRYARFTGEDATGFWIGIHFQYWKEQGASPIWMIFPEGDFGRAEEVAPRLEPMLVEKGIPYVEREGEFSVALDIPRGEDKAVVVCHILDFMKSVKRRLD